MTDELDLAEQLFHSSFDLQIFNEFNARKPDELNVFTGVTKNHLFTGIVGSTFILQVST